MTDRVILECTLHFQRRHHGRKEITLERPGPVLPQGRVPRVARLMALAIHFDELIRRGEVSDYAKLAHFGHVSRARVTQIMNLLLLAPDIQEAVLFLPLTERGYDAIHLRQLQPMALEPDWRKQRQMWKRLITLS